VVRAADALLRLPTPAIHDLTPYGWVMPSAQSAARRHVVEIFARHEAPRPHVCVEVEYTSEAVMGVVMATDLLALVPASVLRSWLGRVQPLPLREFAIQRSQVLLSHPQAHWTPLMTTFRQLLLDQQPMKPQSMAR
jgi:DNA-binding transcriptional LysR family regulator